MPGGPRSFPGFIVITSEVNFQVARSFLGFIIITSKVRDEAWTNEEMRREDYGGSDKRPRHQGVFSSSQSRDVGFSGRGYPRYFQPSRPIQVALQTTNGCQSLD
ncbi:hypothetical protein HAX54_007721 [Datura stramonium]|uniref:Uncharacterized protein n=1 Tax=Datura stramonium TaxID=4076 RepID=A0ABS8TCA0_DATST|nr:hypothetical protein [Datura stramonium]